MHQGELSLLACGISIILQYMNDSLGQHDITQWTLKASRCETFEEVLAGRSFLLQCCGRATFLASIYQMWSLCTNALYLLETTHWPDMPAEMRMHITTPEIPFKIPAILRSAWVPYHPRLNLALAALVRFKAWFLENFDPVAHRDTLMIVNDCILIFQTSVDLVELHAAAHDQPVPAEAILMDASPVVAEAARVPSASTGSSST